ncbi:MAG: hypothetical protein U5K32_11825 [Bacteroidales bacterium]|nr:hypothetical protein [Bacteroidales bacterium]
MSRLFIISLTLLLIFPSASYAQKGIPEEFTMLYYNVDKFFDITDDKGRADDDYLPDGIKAWDSERYKAKLKAVTENIALAVDAGQPDIIGLSGIENKKVINDIISGRRLRRADYKVFITNSDGMNTAFLIKKELMTVDKTETISIDSTFLGKGEVFDYNILYVNGEVLGLGRCHFFINDWPGVKNNSRAPENLRMGAAIALRKKTDEIFNFERDTRIIIMGTFFDEPTSRSLLSVLNASNKRKNFDYRDLYNLFYDRHNIEGEGTVLINSTWQMWDQIIVSPSLLGDSRDYHIEFSSGGIYMPDEVSADRSVLRSTYLGDEYTGAVSAHLPVFCKIKKRGL